MLAATVAGCVLAISPAMGQTSTSDDRIAVSADGTTLTGTDGGGGASLGWLHNFDTSTLAGIAIEHQGLSDAHWTFGSVNGSMAVN